MLKENGFTSMASLKLLAGEPGVLSDIKVSIAQRLHLKKALSTRLHNQGHGSSGLATGGNENPQSLDELLRDLRTSSADERSQDGHGTRGTDLSAETSEWYRAAEETPSQNKNIGRH